MATKEEIVKWMRTGLAHPTVVEMAPPEWEMIKFCWRHQNDNIGPTADDHYPCRPLGRALVGKFGDPETALAVYAEQCKEHRAVTHPCLNRDNEIATAA